MRSVPAIARGVLVVGALLTAVVACTALLGLEDPRQRAEATTDGGDGGAACSPPLEPCGATCVDTTSDPEHCGGCAQVCQGTCTDGVCNPCPDGGNLCAGACRVLESDPEHCGACGHGCLGGACDGGACEAFPLIGPFDAVDQLQVGKDQIFALIQQGDNSALAQVPKTGAPCTSFSQANCVFDLPLSQATDDAGMPNRHEFLAVTDGYLYAMERGGTVLALRLGAGFNNEFFHGQPSIAFVGSPTRTFWSMVRPTFLQTRDNDGREMELGFIGSEMNPPRMSLLTPTTVKDETGEKRLLFAYQGEISSWSTGIYRFLQESGCKNVSCEAQLFYRTIAVVEGMAARGDWLYWSETINGVPRVRRRPVLGLCDPAVCPENLVTAGDPAQAPAILVQADERHVYWVEREGVRRQSLDLRCAIPPCGEFFLPGEFISNLAQDDGAVYATMIHRTNGTGSVSFQQRVVKRAK